MQIIEATKDHFPVIRNIAHATWPVTFGAILSPRQIDYMLDMMYSLPSIEDQVTRGHVFLMVKEGTDYLGYASYELKYKGTTKVKVHKIYVLPYAQGKGVGVLLMNRITDVAKSHEATHLSLNVNRDNKAIQFYERIGFTIVGSEDIDIGNGFLMEDFVMEKALF